MTETTAGNMGPTAILLTGASSGIGAALARAYAGPGRFLALTGRDLARLEEVAAACRAAGAEVATAILDVTAKESVAAWTLEIDRAHPLDLVIANAGISAGTGRGGESAEQTRRILATNIDGVINTVLPVLPRMQTRHRGQIAIVSSLAGFRGFPGAPAYCASKAAVRIWGEALRGELRPQGIGVSVICPGYIATPMTAVNRFPMPFLMDVDKAAQVIVHGLAHNRARIAFPWPMYALVRLVATLPPGLLDRVLSRLPRKE